MKTKLLLFALLSGVALADEPKPNLPSAEDMMSAGEVKQSTPPKTITEAERLLGPSPSAEFIKAFELGVRYGLIAKLNSPDEDSIDELTKEAVKWYAMIECGGWKKLIKEKK